MAFRALVASAFGVVGVLVACGVESVEAKNYNQSCSKNDDCILIDQLEGTTSNKCSVSCVKGAINKKDQEKYEKEYEEEAHDCTSTDKADCSGSPSVAICSAGKCAQSFTNGGTALDAGHD